MNDERRAWTPADLIFSLFKYRALIAVLALIGIITAGAVYHLYQPIYRSEAKLLVRYIMARSAVDPIEAQNSGGGTIGKPSNSVLQSEIEILTSWDLAQQAAVAVGLERFGQNPASPGAANRAATRVRSGLRAASLKESNVVLVEYQDSDPALTVEVLARLVELYFDKHLEAHRSSGALAFVSTQSKEIQERMDATERRLKELKLRADIVSVADSSAALQSDLTRREAEVDAAKAELAAQRARVAQVQKDAGPTPTDDVAPDREILSRYSSIIGRLRALQRQQLEILPIYTAESSVARFNEQQIDQLNRQRAEMENENPMISHFVAASAEHVSRQSRLLAEQATLAALEAKVGALDEQLLRVRGQLQRFAEIAPEISQLERRREAEGERQRYIESSLERARIDGALDPTKIPNISIVQKPSPVGADYGNRDKLAAGIAGGGLALGCGIALALGLLFDRTIKRAVEIEEKAGLSFLTSIPRVRLFSQRLGADKSPRSDSDSLVFGKPVNPIQRHVESLRDRLILGFELSGKIHSPKLVALTGCASGAGTSTIAQALAEALSRTGRGKVLLVDMTTSPLAQPNNGRTIPVTDVLRLGGRAPPTADNLYVATVASVPVELRRPLTTQITELLPHLRTSDFDYVVVDLPSTAESSAALTAAGYVDKVILVVPAETVAPDVLRRTYSELVTARGDVALVFNRERDLRTQWFASAN